MSAPSPLPHQHSMLTVPVPCPHTPPPFCCHAHGAPVVTNVKADSVHQALGGAGRWEMEADLWDTKSAASNPSLLQVGAKISQLPVAFLFTGPE